MAGEGISIRQLSVAETQAFRAIRLRALGSSPEAFGAALEDEAGRDADFFRGRLENNPTFGAFDAGAIVGMAGIYGEAGRKVAHNAVLWGVFVEPDHRGRGIGERLVAAAVERAASDFLQISLSVTSPCVAAKALYERLGFRVYGTAPRALRYGDTYLDELLMIRFLD